MAVIVSHQIREREFGEKIPAEVLEVIRRTSKVALATPIAGKKLPPKTRLLKAYATSAQGPRRLVYMLAVDDGTLFLLFYRSKDDPVGANISPKNPIFAKQLAKHLDMLLADIEAEAFEVIDV